MNEETLSDYEQQQINQLIQQQISSQKLDTYHQEKAKQDKEYERALKIDQTKEVVKEKIKIDPIKDDDFEEPSMDEVRRIRLLRFDQSNKNKKVI